MILRLVLCCALLVAGLACTEREQTPAADGHAADRWRSLFEDISIDTVGVSDLSRADTLCGHPGLTVIETTVRFPEAAAGGEAVAWEFHAAALAPVKLIIMRYDRETKLYELIGESQTLVPRQLGLNRFVLREPIPVMRGDLYGIHMPDQEAVPFCEVTNWKAMICTGSLQRPFMPRDAFAMYGWQYPLRVYWRPPQGE